VVLAGLSCAGYLLAPEARFLLRTESTDDAYVNGHFTFVAPRVFGQVVRVLVDDNNRVRKGDLLVQLDKQPYQIQVQQKQAAVALAKADLVAAQDDVRGLVAQARSNRFKLENTIEQVNNQVASLRANVAALETSRARLARAKADFARAKELQKTEGAISQQDVDLREEAYRVAEAEVTQALEQVYQVRVSLGLPAKSPEGHSLAQVPANLDQNYSAVRQALADLLRSGATLGIFPPSYNATPKEVIADFYKRDPEGDFDRIIAKLIPQVPEIQQAQAKLEQATSDLAQAELNLSYCDVYAEIDGQVTRRNVNPGNNVQAGQSIMVVRSLTEIWIDANFKETQLDYLRIGQRVDMEVDMYGREHKFSGRITGFTMGTGSTLALLPAQNATGNFIKVVQRLPVRIEPVNYDPDKNPLFIGLSVVPHVYVYEPATGPRAGEFLQPPMVDPAPTTIAPRAISHE
jgi:membrane fusion protein, multidrug efflux system